MVWSQQAVRMATLGLVACHGVNGVAEIHTQHLKDNVFKVYRFYFHPLPIKFCSSPFQSAYVFLHLAPWISCGDICAGLFWFVAQQISQHDKWSDTGLTLTNFLSRTKLHWVWVTRKDMVPDVNEIKDRGLCSWVAASLALLVQSRVMWSYIEMAGHKILDHESRSAVRSEATCVWSQSARGVVSGQHSMIPYPRFGCTFVIKKTRLWSTVHGYCKVRRQNKKRLAVYIEKLTGVKVNMIIAGQLTCVSHFVSMMICLSPACMYFSLSDMRTDFDSWFVVSCR